MFDGILYGKACIYSIKIFLNISSKTTISKSRKEVLLCDIFSPSRSTNFYGTLFKNSVTIDGIQMTSQTKVIAKAMRFKESHAWF